VETKSGAIVAEGWVESISRWRALAGRVAESPWIVYGGEQRQSRSTVELLPWCMIDALIPKVWQLVSGMGMRTTAG
jgi:hypothetical protein